MTVQTALQALLDKGAQIEQIEADKFKVYDNGFWGFFEQVSPFIVDGDEILYMYDRYVEGEVF